jgi:RNA polymerase sigma-70 factor (ECF subfamily)
MQDRKASLRFIERCYRLYEQKMYQVAYSILRDEGMAEDAVQEAFLKLMNSDTYFDDVKSDDCKRYIITVIKHSSITIYNKKKREQQVIYLSDQDDDFAQLEEGADDEDRQNLRLLMDKLPDKYYEVVDCMVVKELSVKETAKELAITEANVRKRFQRAKLLLKTIVKGSGEYEEFRFI